MNVYTWDDIEKGKFLSKDELMAKGYHGTAVTVGAFDGVHRGHRALFDAVLSQHEMSGVVTFRFPPKVKTMAESFAGSLSTLDQRLECFKALGMDFVLVIDFSGDFGRMRGDTFLQLLTDRLHMVYLAEGADFRCGYKGAVGIREIKEFAYSHGIVFQEVPSVMEGETKVSSSEIRKALLAGDTKKAATLLGYDYTLDGSCFSWTFCSDRIRGSQESELSGYKQLLPQSGNYTGKVRFLYNGQESCIDALLSVGEKTVDILCKDVSSVFAMGVDSPGRQVIRTVEFTV
ncbi:MAG: FAD synthetase family protein [Spirochaetia bacterium]|nr:FAD synthetase family protein [Spirochaetia bacterium]